MQNITRDTEIKDKLIVTTGGGEEIIGEQRGRVIKEDVERAHGLSQRVAGLRVGGGVIGAQESGDR